MRALGPEPDVEKIHTQVQTQLRTALRKGYKPGQLRVSFSNDGYHRAQYEGVPGMNPWGNPTPMTGTYLGLPFDMDRKQTVDVLVLTRDGASNN